MGNCFVPKPYVDPHQRQDNITIRSLKVSRPPETAGKEVRAIYGYNAPNDGSSSDDLSFKAGDVMVILEEDGDWWLAENKVTKQRGFIPCTYVVVTNSLDNFDWYHGKIKRSECERFLQESKLGGSFMIRDSETVEGTYTLSVLHTDGSLKHYRIKQMDNSANYCINSRNSFKTLEILILFYQNNEGGLCCRLTQPCKKLKPTDSDLSRKTRDKWEVDRKTIELNHKIGSGNFGEVWKGMWNKKAPIAVKIMKPGSMEQQTFLDEAAIMKQLRHPKLVKLYAVCSLEEPIYIITEFMVNGCLQIYLKEDGGRTIKWNKLIDYAAQVASGMQFIESKNYVHRDLAARNVLVGENNMVKIGDFGLAKALDGDKLSIRKDTKFPVRWTAVETITHQKYSIKSDVWAFGIFLVELVTYGALPYPGLSNAEVQNKLQGSYRHPKPTGCNDDLYEIMITCWHKDPQLRPTFEHLFHMLDDFLVATQGAYA